MAEFAAHTVKSFDEDIAQLRAVITRMGGLCESQIAESVDALMNRNAEAAQTIIENDKRLDALEAEAGMAQMSKVYDETGRELYMGQGDREHD